MSKNLKHIRHSAAHILALAVGSLFPKVQLVSGEATSLGFYYDFYFPEPITKEQIPFIEERMWDFIRQKIPFKVVEMMRKNAIELFKYHHQDLKVALLKANVETLVHICQIGHFYDLGYPPFVETTQQIGVIKILEVSHFNVSLPGKPNLPLTRIQGTAFPDQNSLKQFLKMKEGAKEKDHRLLGKEMHLFSTFEDTCPGCWTWEPKGCRIREALLNWWHEEHRKQKYQAVMTPNLIKAPHEKNFQGTLVRFEPQGSSYTTYDTKAPLHALIFKSKLRSYRELPIRYSELGEVYDQGKESHHWGLLHTRAYTADYAYTFCTAEQLLAELTSSLQFINKTINILGFDADWHLLSGNQNSRDFPKKWKESQEVLVDALNECGFTYTVDEEEEASYGPTAVLYFTDALGRKWKGSYVYIDLFHPEKLGLHYQGNDDQMHLPQMVGRSMLGSLERLIAVLLEHHSGVLPLWLSPEQVRILPVAEKNREYAKQVFQSIEKAGFRVEIDERKENLGAKMHAAENERVPYLLVIGDKEEKNRSISVRKYLQKDGQDDIVLENFLEQLNLEIEKKT